MRRASKLFEKVVERDNLRLAFWRASRGKRARTEVKRYALCLDANLLRLAERTQDGSLPLGRFHQFVIHDPKERIITAPCFEERVLHHAIMNVCEPIFDRWLIADTYACRTGKGREAAVQRARQFARRFPVFLKLDVRKYFDSIPHGRLSDQLHKLFKDRRLLELFERIIGAFRGSTSRGLPIGSLTSQHFANAYLGKYDRFVKEQLRLGGYVRYMDDIVLWTKTLREARRLCEASEAFITTEVGLALKPAFVNRSAHGLDFLGCRVFPTHITLSSRSKRRFGRKLQQVSLDVLHGSLTESDAQQRYDALLAFARGAGVASWRFRRALLQRLEVCGP